MRPQAARFTHALPDWPMRPLPTVRVAQTMPAPEEHRARIGAALQQLNDPGSGLHKVVLARALRLTADSPLDARTIVRRLVAADPAANTYLADLTPAGGDYSGPRSSAPVRSCWSARRGDRWSPADRSRDRHRDRPTRTPTVRTARALAASAKNRHEHELVVDAMRKALDPLCVDLQIRRLRSSAAPPRCGTCPRRSADGYAKHPPPHWTSRSRCIRRRRSAAFPTRRRPG